MSGRLRFGYGTNGLADHRLDDALAFLAESGYQGVALTLDHHHLDPFAPDLTARVEHVVRRLADLGLAVVVETGARFLLDARAKHQPTLLSDEADGRARRLDYLTRAVRVGAGLGAEAVSFWSGTPSPGCPPDEAWRRLVDGCARLMEEATRAGVTVGFEPEPGMLVDRIDGYERLAAALGHPAGFGLTLDVGHCRCNEDDDAEACIRRVGAHLVNVQIEDMRRSVHEHLDFGEGEIDFPAVLGALAEVGYAGLVSVELPRDSHRAHEVVPRSLRFLRTAEMVSAVAADPAAVRTRFPAAARVAGRAPVPGPEAAGGLLFTLTQDDAARIALLDALGERVGEELADLYRHGDAAERRAVLRWLGRRPDGPPPPGVPAIELIEDALRSSDPRLLAAALGPWAMRHLDDPTLAQAVLKCVFVGVPLAGLAGLRARAGPELARMLAGYVHERVAAGRDVPVDVWPLIDAYPPEAELAAIEAELGHPVAERRRAAATALAGRTRAGTASG
ncbi:MAG: TIM barrel protein [Acidimicrobiia bacterium]